MNDKKERFIDNWKIRYSADSCCFHLEGYAVHDNRFAEGTYIRTSMLENIDFAKMKAETHNSIYILMGYDYER
jgi:hypothetical protein